jgi:hypothetical protein
VTGPSHLNKTLCGPWRSCYAVSITPHRQHRQAITRHDPVSVCLIIQTFRMHVDLGCNRPKYDSKHPSSYPFLLAVFLKHPSMPNTKNSISLDESICDSSSNMASIDTNPKSSSSTTHLHLYNLRWRSSRLSASSSTTSLDSLAKEKVAYHDDEAGGQKKLKPIESALAHKRATSTISPQSLIRSSASLVLREPPGIPPGKVLSATFTMIKVVK